MSTVMTPAVGAVYKFKFSTEFEEYNGTYRVTEILSYDEYLNSGGDIDSDFFGPNSQSAILEQELPKVRESKILKLEIPDPNSDIPAKFAPLCYVAETPDFNVKCYKEFGIIAYIGICEDPTVFEFMKDTVTQTVEAAFGITPDPQFVVTGEQWLADSEYNEVLQERDESKKKVLNYYSENQRLEKELSQLRTQIAEYERLIVNLQSQIDNLTS